MTKENLKSIVIITTACIIFGMLAALVTVLE